MFRLHVISAIFWRNVSQYFSSILGYLFIVVFVTLCALATFSPQFFSNNVATLDQLTEWLPTLLLFLTPAITMTAWADERRQGTDSLLFTLPASDVEILLGKYLSVAAVYSIALLFSMTQLIALSNLGQPDWGIIFSTYLGYWLVGLALLAIGMFASSLTDSPSVAFVLGVVFCFVPVLIGRYFRGNMLLEPLGIEWYLRDFSVGLITISGIVYFVSLMVVFLYLNLVMISRRHWRSNQGPRMWTRYGVRFVSLAVALVSVNYIVNANSTNALTRIDATAEHSFSLDPMTLETLRQVSEADRKVTIQAFISEDVPRNFVETKQRLLGTLRQIDYFGKQNVEVQIESVKPFSEAAASAERLGILPQNDRSEIGGKSIDQDVYMGLYVSGSLDDVTIPQLNSKSAIEYELTRAVAATSQDKWQIKVGILNTDQYFGNIEINGRTNPWTYDKTYRSLKSVFGVSTINQDDLGLYVAEPSPPVDPAQATTEAIPETKPAITPPDVLIVADPSSLSDPAAEMLVKYMESGNPTLLLFDPLPVYWTTKDPERIGVLNAPRQERVGPQSPFVQALSNTPLPKADMGNATKILSTLGMQWNNGRVTWSTSGLPASFRAVVPDYLGDRWPEYLGQLDVAFNFVKGNEPSTFNFDDDISKNLKELLFVYSGEFRRDENAQGVQFTPLVSLGTKSGTIEWEDITEIPMSNQRSMNPKTGRFSNNPQPIISQITGNELVVIRPRPTNMSIDSDSHVIAARIVGTGDKKLNVVAIADLDFLSDFFYDQLKNLDSVPDNFSFFQNAIEVLAGRSGFVTLRNRRTTPRSLSAFEDRVASIRAQRAEQERANEQRIQDQLKVAQEELDKQIASIDEDQTANFFEKLQRSSQSAVDAQANFERKQQKMMKDLKKENDKLKDTEGRQVAKLENGIRAMAVTLAPLPAILLGIFVFLRRSIDESKQVRPERKVP